MPVRRSLLGLSRKKAVVAAARYQQQQQPAFGDPFPFHHPFQEAEAQEISLGTEASDGHPWTRAGGLLHHWVL